MKRENVNYPEPTPEQLTLALLVVLQIRFNSSLHLHPNLEWGEVQEKLLKNPKLLNAVLKMEQSNGEPDVVSLEIDGKSTWCFVDCSTESPKGRRSLCYDREAWLSRKENKPVGSAQEWAEENGVKILDEAQYLALQKLQAFDLKTSSWLLTPDSVRSLGGAIFGDFRFGRVFIYHNGAESYYAARGFRTFIQI